MKTSNVWIHYTEDPKDKTKAICQVNDCGFRASRGKTGGGTAHLTTSGMLSHLKNKHPKQHKEVLNMNNEVRTANSQKRLLEEEADEMETREKAHLKTEAERVEFLRKDKQPRMNGFLLGSTSQKSSLVYEFTDPRAKELHRAVLEHLIVDVKPFSTVDGRGFVKMQNTFHPNFKLGSSQYYREKVVKIYDLARTQIKEKIERDQPVAFSAQLDGWSLILF